MKWLVVSLMILVPTLATAQEADRPAAQQGSAPNYGTRPDANTGPGGQEIRPGSPDGDMPSASVGQLDRSRVEPRIFGLPATTVLVIGGIIVGMLVMAGLILPGSRPRPRARNGALGRR